MTQRLPVVGSDDNSWGSVLNGYLSVSLNSDGSLNSSAVSTAGAEMTSHKGQASGYAGLNASGLVTSSELGSGTASSSTYLRGDGTWNAPAASGSAAGDLSGTYPNPTVAKVNGVSVSGTAASGKTIIATGSTTASWTAPPYLSPLTPSGDTSGATDAANIQALCTTGAGQIWLGSGTFYIGGSSPVTLATGNWLHGSGTAATIITIASGFTGSSVLSFSSGGYERISDLSIVGASTTITSNPVCNGIEGGTGRYCRVDNVFFQYINGWCGEDVDSGTASPLASMWTNISGLNCAGGIHFKGVSGVTWAQQQFLSNINFQSIGVGTGTSANLDVFRFEDSWDVTAMNFNTSISDASSGSSINIIGQCASLYFTNMDLGCFPNAASMSNACIKIQDGANGSPADIRFVQGEAQQGQNGLLISGGASTIHFDEFRFFNNYGSGAKLTGTGSEINFMSCGFSLNGQGGAANSGTYYDLEVTGSSGEARFSRYSSSVVTVGTNGVQMPVALPTAGYGFYHHFCTFSGSGTPSIPFTHVPGLFSRADTVPPQWNGRMNVTSGQASNSGFQAQNTTSAPTAPFSQFIAAGAGDQTAGVLVNGDTVSRLLIDSNGKHSWGAGGSSAADTNLYRSGANVLTTDDIFSVGTGIDMAAGQALGMAAPATNSLIAWNMDPVLCQGSSTGTSETLYLMRVDVTRTVTTSKLFLAISGTAAVTVTFAKAGIFNSSGTLITAAADISTNITTANNLFSVAYAAALTPGFYWVGVCIEAATMPSLVGASTVLGILGNANLNATNGRFASNGTTHTSFPTTITPSSNSIATNTKPWWVGIS